MVLNEHRLKASPAPPLSSTSIHLAPHPLPQAAPSSWTVLGHGEGPRAHCWLGSCGPPSGPCGRSQGGCYMGPGSLHWVLGWPQGGLRAAVEWPLGGRSVGSQGLACRTNSPRGEVGGPPTRAGCEACREASLPPWGPPENHRAPARAGHRRGAGRMAEGKAGGAAGLFAKQVQKKFSRAQEKVGASLAACPSAPLARSRGQRRRERCARYSGAGRPGLRRRGSGFPGETGVGVHVNRPT